MSEDDLVTMPDGGKMPMKLIRGQEATLMMRRKRNFLKKLPNEKKLEFYYKVYEILAKHEMEDKKDPLFQLGLSPYTFLNEVLRIGNFQTTYGELFGRMHQALNEAELSFSIEEK